MNFAGALRSELLERARAYALSENLPHCVGYEGDPAICFEPYEDGLLHGNFHPASYKAIRRNPEWASRLGKVHTLGHRLFPRSDFGRRRELDTSTSSDALLMNIFCHTATARSRKFCEALGIEGEAKLCFGYRARVPLVNGRSDRTEVDLRFGDQLMEAKLTENDFQRVKKCGLAAYRDYTEIFDWRRLPQTADHYASYQLLRNILAAHALGCSFRVLVDARRPDLVDQWYAVMSCVKPVDLRTKLKISTWQELAGLLPAKLQVFLAMKYGIETTGYPTNDSRIAFADFATTHVKDWSFKRLGKIKIRG
jgi:hypothetical protein